MGYPVSVQIDVKYVHADGAHFFLSADDRCKGLCVAHEDLWTAYNEVAETLSVLMKEGEKLDLEFMPMQSVAQYWKAYEGMETGIGQWVGLGPDN